MRYRRIFRLLLICGHSGLSARQIIDDASRGDQIALTWIRFHRRLKHAPAH